MSDIVWVEPCRESVWELLPSGPVAWNDRWGECWQYLGSVREERAARLRHEFRHRAHPAFDDARVYAHVFDDDAGPRLGRLIADSRELALPDGPLSEEVWGVDPDACLSEIRSIVRHADDLDPDVVEGLFDRLVDLVDRMDTWMSRGGRPPKPWLLADLLRLRDPHHEPPPAGDEHKEDGLDGL